MIPCSISVVVPVYQSAERLPDHLECLRRLQTRVQEIIWVITESPDGSHQTARQAAREIGGRVLEVPRGLYQAWNVGVAAAQGEFIYISTVGDTIGPEGLAQLHETLRKSDADLVFSPPAIHPSSDQNRRMTMHWPVFRFADLLADSGGRKIPKEKAFLMQILAGASGLTGSAASCLFRATVLKNRPFPTDCHHYGDTGWLYQNLPEITLTYCPRAVARFVVHDSDLRRRVDKEQIYKFMLELGTHLSGKLLATVRDFVQASQRIDAIRDPHPKLGWWCSPEAWLFRIRRQTSKNLLNKCLHQVFYAG